MDALAVTGVGMVTPVGFDSAQTSCAVRAGIAQFAELPHTVDQSGTPVVAARLPDWPIAKHGHTRLWDHARAAADEARADAHRAHLSGRPLHLSVLTSEPDRPGSILDRHRSAGTLSEFLGLPPDTAVDIYPLGNAAAAAALVDARSRLRQMPELVEVIVGLDSLIGVPSLAYLERSGRLKSASRPRGVIAGEGAACLVVESEEAARRWRRRIRCRVTGIGFATEPSPIGSESPCLGDGLTAAIRTALEMARWTDRDVARVYCDLNGEEYRVHEWMLALCRTIEAGEIVHPADCLGDVGAAFGPLLVGLAALRMSREPGAGRALVFCSSDFGSRGSLCLETSAA